MLRSSGASSSSMLSTGSLTGAADNAGAGQTDSASASLTPALVVADYDGEGEHDLKLRVNDIVLVSYRGDDGWWLGFHHSRLIFCLHPPSPFLCDFYSLITKSYPTLAENHGHL